MCGGCRFAVARIKTPADPPAIAEFRSAGSADSPWVYDWYSHVLFAQRLFEAASNIARELNVPELEEAVRAFSEHWQMLKPVRDWLQHPMSRSLNPEHLWPFHDRLTYQRPKFEPDWELSLEELPEPVEALFAAVEELCP